MALVNVPRFVFGIWLIYFVQDYPKGIVPLSEFQNLIRRKANPFDSPTDSSLSSSPSSSDEELYTHALSLQTPIAPVQALRKAPPPPPPSRSTKPAESHDSLSS
jgi:hypothetical protein